MSNTPPLQYHSHIKKNAKRLILPFIITMLLLSGWGLLQAILKHNWNLVVIHPLCMLWASYDIIDYEPVGLIYAGPMWFLLALFWIREVFYYGAGWLLGKVKRWGDELVLVCSIVVSIIMVLIHPLIAPIPWSICQGLAAIQFYAIGWYVHRHSMHWWIKAICIICWALALKWGGINLSSCGYVCYPLDTLGAYGAVLVLYGIFDWISKTIQCHCPKIYTDFQTPLQWLGINSLAVLCMHTFELHSSLLFSILCRLPFDITGGWLVALRMAFAIGLAWLVMHMPGLKKVYGK